MEDRHRHILQVNRSALVLKLNPSEVCDGLLSRGVFTQDMIDEIKNAGPRRDQARQLVRDLETRGRSAFPFFLECLYETGQQDLAELLQSQGAATVPIPIIVEPSIIPLPDRRNVLPEPIPLKPTSLPDFVQPIPSPESKLAKPRPARLRSDSLQSYKMDASPCGICLIINNVEFLLNTDLKNRSGSDIDSEKLKKRFKSLNFSVISKRNLTHKEIQRALSELRKMDHSEYDCCVVIILSHGTEASHNQFPGAVYGVDGAALSVQSITNYLTGQHCPSLQGKPKVFFIQACGGDKKDVGFEVSPDEVENRVFGTDEQSDAIPASSSSDSLSLSDEPDARTALPSPSDILVSYSTFPGYVSWRDTQTGSWYVEMLDQVLEFNAATDDLDAMLMMVNNEVSQISAKGLYKQMPGSFNFLRKRLYFQQSAALSYETDIGFME